MMEWLNQPVEAVWVFIAILLAGFAGRGIALWLDCRRLERLNRAYARQLRDGAPR